MATSFIFPWPWPCERSLWPLLGAFFTKVTVAMNNRNISRWRPFVDDLEMQQTSFLRLFLLNVEAAAVKVSTCTQLKIHHGRQFLIEGALIMHAHWTNIWNNDFEDNCKWIKDAFSRDHQISICCVALLRHFQKAHYLSKTLISLIKAE